MHGRCLSPTFILLLRLLIDQRVHTIILLLASTAMSGVDESAIRAPIRDLRLLRCDQELVHRVSMAALRALWAMACEKLGAH